jgi:hypothetical protein
MCWIRWISEGRRVNFSRWDRVFRWEESRIDSRQVFLYAITAKHVIEGIKNKGIDMVLLRLNRKSEGPIWVRTSASGWLSSPSDQSVDVAAIGFSFDDSLDHLFYPLEGAATRAIIEGKKIDVGDEVCVAGLFARV